MAYNLQVEQRIDEVISSWPDLEKKKMFGGVCYLTRGNICFGIWQDQLIIRTDPSTARNCLQLDHVRQFDVTGRPMKGWLMVAAAGWRSDTNLQEWLVMGLNFSLTLPAK
ncbi:MAG: TfoX/Sxy family protein [Geobacteraceae bacterium]|jgi:TfoX/Sxy family transcriptional regulator of competence genes